jgi:hypothetical protein
MFMRLSVSNHLAAGGMKEQTVLYFVLPEIQDVVCTLNNIYIPDQDLCKETHCPVTGIFNSLSITGKNFSNDRDLVASLLLDLQGSCKTNDA